MAGQIFHDGNNILASDVSDDAQPLKHGSKGRGCLWGGRDGICGIPGWLRMEVFHKDILHLMQGPFHRQGRGYLLDHRLYLHAVDRLLDEELNACLVGRRDHFLGRYLGEHDEGSMIKERAGFLHEGDASISGIRRSTITISGFRTRMSSRPSTPVLPVPQTLPSPGCL